MEPLAASISLRVSPWTEPGSSEEPGSPVTVKAYEWSSERRRVALPPTYESLNGKSSAAWASWLHELEEQLVDRVLKDVYLRSTLKRSVRKDMEEQLQLAQRELEAFFARELSAVQAMVSEMTSKGELRREIDELLRKRHLGEEDHGFDRLHEFREALKAQDLAWRRSLRECAQDIRSVKEELEQHCQSSSQSMRHLRQQRHSLNEEVKEWRLELDEKFSKLMEFRPDQKLQTEMAQLRKELEELKGQVKSKRIDDVKEEMDEEEPVSQRTLQNSMEDLRREMKELWRQPSHVVAEALRRFDQEINELKLKLKVPEHGHVSPLPIPKVPKAQTIVVIGETGTGKSSFCGLCDGSLHLEKGSGWTSNFKVGHEGHSETKQPELREARWLGQSDGKLFMLMDTPGWRGPQQEYMQQLQGAIQKCPTLHGVVLLLDDKMPTRRNFWRLIDVYQQILGKDMWQHCVIVVNRWSHDSEKKTKRLKGDLMTQEKFEKDFRELMTRPTPSQDSGELGLGLTGDEAKAVSFYFIDTNYDRKEQKESMKDELDQLKIKLLSLTAIPMVPERFLR